MAELGLITNPTAASGRGAKWGAEAAAELARLGHRLRDLSRGSWAASYEAAIEHRDELDGLVVVGGDGMTHLGAQVCAEHALPLGLMAAGSGNDVAATLKLPIHDMRAAARRIADTTFREIHVATPAEVCERRDPKGHYAKARAGVLHGFTGIGNDYQPPVAAELTIDTSVRSIADSADAIERMLIETSALIM